MTRLTLDSFRLDRADIQRWRRRGLDLLAGGRDRLAAWVAPLGRRLGGISRFDRIVAASVLAGGVTLVVADVVLGTPSAEAIRGMTSMPVATTILDRDDQPAFTVYEERRLPVALPQVSPHMVQAVLAVEDERFYQHDGLDLWRIGGAMLANIREGGWAQGGSTITQQLARQSFLTPAKSLRRKLKEAYLAVRIERRFTKDEILETYLNKVYFGAGFYGIEAASRGYFGKPASDLDVEEAALLAGLIQAPSAYAPTSHPERATDRRAIVLNRMADTGVIDSATATDLAGRPLQLVNGFAHEGTGDYFKQAVTRELIERFGWDMVSKAGLRVYTTLDPVAQRAAETALASGLDALETRRVFRHPTRIDVTTAAAASDLPDRTSPDYLQGALVAVDPSTGAVRALVGGRAFGESQFDRATQARRQAGSAFKPFVYAAALEMGYSPATLITGFDQPFETPEGAWVPNDGHADGAEVMTLRTALRTSSNRAAAQVLRAVGIPQAVQQAERMGMTAPPVPALVLGAGDVSLMSLTTAYGAFANGGWLRPSFLIRRVEDADGRVLFDEHPLGTRVVSEETSFLMAQMLADVVDRGTGHGARQAGFRLPAAGKTGTTNDYFDAWFVGFTPDLVAGVWVGFDQPKSIMANGYASDVAVPIWGAFMRDATKGAKAVWLDRPSNVVAAQICRESGLLPGDGCTRVAATSRDGEPTVKSAVGVEYFRRGTVPTEHCPIHGLSRFFGHSTTNAFDLNDLPSATVIGLRPGPPRATGTTGPDDEADQKKRGFWARLFGRGGGV